MPDDDREHWRKEMIKAAVMAIYGTYKQEWQDAYDVYYDMPKPGTVQVVGQKRKTRSETAASKIPDPGNLLSHRKWLDRECKANSTKIADIKGRITKDDMTANEKLFTNTDLQVSLETNSV